MHPSQRLVNQQLAFAKTQLQLSLTENTYLHRCHQQAALLQLAAALQAYANELLHRLNLPPYFATALSPPPYFGPALANVQPSHPLATSALAECAALEQSPGWLHSALQQIQHGLTAETHPLASPVLQHTSLQQPLIASSRNNPQNSSPEYPLAHCLEAFSALVQRQRNTAQEY